VERRQISPQDEECLFCKIVAGEVPASVVFEDAESIAFLDTRPLFPGHVLLIPKAHYETLADLPEKSVTSLFLGAQKLASVVKETMEAEGTFVAMNNVVSQSVPHFHIHIVPRKRKDGLKGFFWPRHKYKNSEEQEAIREKLASHLNMSKTNSR
jgi:histidine triad (HIT) family protein